MNGRLSLVRVAFALIPAIAGCQSQATHADPYAAQVAEEVPKVEHAVGLRFKKPPVVQSRSRSEVRQFLEREFNSDRSAREISGTELSYKLFGLIPDSLHLRSELEGLLVEQIAGFYDPHTKVLYIVDSAPPAQVSVVISHELVHALQDQYVRLDSLEEIEGQNDRASAAQAVIEGQAVYDQLVAATGNPDFLNLIPGGWDRVREEIRDNQATMPAFSRAPMVLQETLIFPYLSGAEFMRHFMQHDPGQQPFGALMPTSTKEILHPETAFFAHRDVPTIVTLPPVTEGTVRYANNLGEFETRLFLYHYSNDENAAVRGAAGWEGDRYEVIVLPDSNRVLAWVTVWDSPVDAGQFRAMALDIAAKRAKSTQARRVTVTPIEIQGKPVVIYVDTPMAMSRSRWIDPSRVTLVPES